MSVVLVVRPSDEPSGHPIAPRFLHLLENGWDPHLALIGGGAARLQRSLPAETLERIRTVPTPTRSGRRVGVLLGVRRGRRREGGSLALRSLLVDLSAELVHLPSAAMADRWIEDMSGVQSGIVVSFRGDDLDGDALNVPEGYRKLWERADALSFESEGMAQLASRLGAPRAKTRVVPPVADVELVRKPRPRSEADSEHFRILSIGPLSWTQGYEHALAAVQLLRERGLSCRYRIVGQGGFADAVAYARHQLELEDAVEILPPPRPELLREHLLWADAFLNSAVTASSPKHVVDAQASGVPVVTTEAPSAGPATALVVPAYDPHALADALGLVATDMALRDRLARDGREAASSARALADQLDRFCDLYRTVLAGVPA